MSNAIKKNLCQFFEEDLVYQVSSGGSLQVGVIVESNENSDSDDDIDDDESESTKTKLEPGKAKVAWYPKGKPQVVVEKKVELFDRSLLTGDVVKRFNVNGGQLGLVCNSKVDLVCKIIGTKQVVLGIQSSDFIYGIDLCEDILFYYRNWIGAIEDIQCQVLLSLPDGSVVKMAESALLNFKDVSSERSRNNEFDDSSPYIGQQVVVPRHLIPTFNFVSSEPKIHNYERSVVMTVIQIQVDQVQAHWLCCIASQSMTLDESQFLLEVKPPSTVIEGDGLKEIVQLDYFRQGNIEMGDRGIHILNDSNRVTTYSEWSRQAADKLRNRKLGLELLPSGSTDGENDEDFTDVDSEDEGDSKDIPIEVEIRWRNRLRVSIQKIRQKYIKPSKNVNLSRKLMKFDSGTQLPVEVIATNTFADIMWQDGSIERGCSSTDLYPMHHLDGHEYFPGDFVVKSKCEFSHNQYGVIQTVDRSERTAKVQWLEVGSDQKPQFVSEQEVSVYDLEDHPDFNFRPGSCVARLTSRGTEKLAPAAKAGQVVWLRISGSIDCVWADGSRSEVYPQELYLIGDYDDDDLWAGQDDESDGSEEMEYPARSRVPMTPPRTYSLEHSSSSNTPKTSESERELIDRLRRSVNGLEDWLTQYPTLNNQNGHLVVRKLTSLLENLEAVDNNMNTSLTKLKDLQILIESVRLPDSISGRTAHINGKLTKLVKSILKGKRAHDLQGGEESEEMVCEGAASDSSPISTKTRPSLDILHRLKTQLFSVCPQAESGTEINGIDQPSSSPSFQQVDHVPDSHKFKLSIFQTGNQRTFFTRVRKEMDLLRTSLPKDIFVKGFEDRMDLFSVLIKGPNGTPYEDGLFLFDVQLPAAYPNVPPLVHYIPFCRDRLNPNLYESGKVCVSLLGTWSGKGSEVWSPVDSTLLQLFISIQGLILVPEPYFNEAGYTRQKGTNTGDENSRLYNEMAVVKVVESMTRMASSPPETFREEIISHVKSTSSSFISRLESWIQISRSSKEDKLKLDFPLLPASKGFCLSLTSALESFRTVLYSLE